MTDKTMVSTSMDDMLETINRTFKCAKSAENLRCVTALEAKALEAKKLGRDDIYQYWINAAELIRIR